MVVVASVVVRDAGGDGCAWWRGFRVWEGVRTKRLWVDGWEDGKDRMWGRRCAAKLVCDCNDREAKSHNVVNGGIALVENRLSNKEEELGRAQSNTTFFP